MQDIVESFIWASRRSLEWVQTGRRAGYLPSYWAGLPDRAMFYSRDLAHQMLGAHLLGLDTENLAMLRRFAASATEARGWYPLWAFDFEGTPAAIDYHSDDHFVRETPAPFELVEKAVEQFRWTGDDRFLRSAEIARFIRTTVTVFVDAHDPRGDGVAGESGSGDIFLGTATYNEVETPPFLRVAGDGIASQWAAHRALAGLAGGELDPESGGESDRESGGESGRESGGEVDRESHSGFAEWNRRRARQLDEIFSREWWLPAEDHYATGFTTAGPATAFGLESTWFPAVKGVMRTDRRAGAHLDFLTAGLATNPPGNIEAFTYLPEAFLRYGRDETALGWIRHLAASRADYPEVPFTHVAHVAAGLTGIEPGHAPGDVRTRSHLPAGHWLEVDGVAIGDSVIGVRHDGREATELWVVEGPPVTWTATWDDTAGTTVRVASGSRVRTGADGSLRHLATPL